MTAPVRGRPPLAQPRDAVIAVRVTSRERRKIERAAKGAQRSVSDWIRLAVLEAAGA